MQLDRPVVVIGAKDEVRRAIALNEAYSPSFALLANVLLQGSQPATALEPAVMAVRLDQRDSYPRLVLARVYWRLARGAEAMGVARSGLALARSDQQRAAAKELITFMEANKK